MTSNTDQMVGVNVQCTWNGVSGKIDDMVSISHFTGTPDGGVNPGCPWNGVEPVSGMIDGMGMSALLSHQRQEQMVEVNY